MSYSRPGRLGILSGWLALLLLLPVFAAGCGKKDNTDDVEEPDDIPPAMEADGHLDKVDSKSIEGWAWDRGQQKGKRTVDVEIYADGKLLGKATANVYRKDLPVKKHGFRFATPKDLVDGKEHKIQVKNLGTNSYLPTDKNPNTYVYD